MVFNWKSFWDEAFLIWELTFIYYGLFLSSSCLDFLFFFVCCFFFSLTFRPNFTSGLLQVILPRPRIGMMSLVNRIPSNYCLSIICLYIAPRFFDQVNLWPAWVGFKNRYLLTMLTWNRRGLNASIRCATSPEGRIFFGLIILLIILVFHIRVRTEGSNLLGIQVQDSSFLSEVAVNHLKKARGEIWPKRSEKKKQHKKTKKLTRWGQKVCHK